MHIILLLGLISCGSESENTQNVKIKEGSMGGDCYGNSTCNVGLECKNQKCSKIQKVVCDTPKKDNEIKIKWLSPESWLLMGPMAFPEGTLQATEKIVEELRSKGMTVNDDNAAKKDRMSTVIYAAEGFECFSKETLLPYFSPLATIDVLNWESSNDVIIAIGSKSFSEDVAISLTGALKKCTLGDKTSCETAKNFAISRFDAADAEYYSEVYEVTGTTKDTKEPWLNLRAKKSKDAQKIAALKDGTLVYMGFGAGKGMAKITVLSGEHMGKVGFVHNSYLQQKPPQKQ